MKTKEAKVTVTPVVWFDIQAIPDMLRKTFFDWQGESEIFPVHSKYSGATPIGPGRIDPSRWDLHAAFFADEAEQVIQWFEARGIPIERID